MGLVRGILAVFICLAGSSCSSALTVTTPQNSDLWFGETSTIQCTVDGNADGGVYWARPGPSILVTLAPGGEVTLGDPNYAGKYNMTRNHTLYIYKTNFTDSGDYTCAARLLEGTIKTASTNATVFDEPDGTYPTITGCEKSTKDDDDDDDTCDILLPKGVSATSLTCTASGFYPKIDLAWSKNGKRIPPTSDNWSFDGGDKKMSVSVTITANATLTDLDPFVCTASGDAVKGSQKTAAVRVYTFREKTSTKRPSTTKMTTMSNSTKGEDSGDGGSNSGLWIGIGIVIAIIVIVIGGLVTMYFIRKRRTKKSHKNVKYSKPGGTMEEEDLARAS